MSSQHKSWVLKCLSDVLVTTLTKHLGQHGVVFFPLNENEIFSGIVILAHLSNVINVTRILTESSHCFQSAFLRQRDSHLEQITIISSCLLNRAKFEYVWKVPCFFSPNWTFLSMSVSGFVKFVNGEKMLFEGGVRVSVCFLSSPQSHAYKKSITMVDRLTLYFYQHKAAIFFFFFAFLVTIKISIRNVVSCLCK